MNTAVKTRTEGSRTYLEGIDFRSWGAGEMCEFASALTAMLRGVGSDVPYHYVMGVTGVAFRFTFGAEHWNPGFYGFAGVAADVQDLIRRAFAAVGYGYAHHVPGDRPEDLRRIRESIDRGIAVMLKGHVIDASDWVIITGYEGEGDVLLGMSPYSPGDKGERFKGYDVIREWHPKTKDYVILGNRCARPPAVSIYTAALRLAVDLVRAPQAGNRITGLQGYEALAAVLREGEFPDDSEQKDGTLWFRYLCLLCYNMMLDDHKSAAPFLRDAAQALPRCAAELGQAADCYVRSCALRDQLDAILPGNFSKEAQRRVLDPEVRTQFARVILQIRDSDEQGISHIEKALAR